jgi:hypothetical protein
MDGPLPPRALIEEAKPFSKQGQHLAFVTGCGVTTSKSS